MGAVTLLPRYDRNNGWFETLPEVPPAAPLSGPTEADVVVVGAGFTGLAAARRLAELRPEARILLVEAGRIGNSAAGRSSGFAIDHAHNIRSEGFADSATYERQQIALNRAGQAYLAEAVTAHGIDCDWTWAGKIHAACTDRGARDLDRFAATLDLLDEDYELLDREATVERLGIDYYQRALHTPGTVLLQPAALCRGLAASLPSNVTVHEETPVTWLDEGPPHELYTDGGTIRTPEVVLANNGFAAGFGFYARHLIPVVTWGSMTRPLTDEESASIGGDLTWGVIPAAPSGTTVRRLVDGRILVRNVYSYSRHSMAGGRFRRRAARAHRVAFERRFPGLAHVPFDYSWGGALSMARNGEPVFGRLADGIHGALVHNGTGLSRGAICGKLIAEMVCGEGSDLLDAMLARGRPNRNLPDPLLGWGVNLYARRLRMRSGREM
ncbi:MAG TPA: FAD-binding oxidoreductase [Acidimicrobiia bacterium]|jgi:glycine/D-amino acid oxidase-like deaminating enzyme|nr:FAD-binding oxidoreductase [Acidimicrobiia bacterium]